MNSEDFRKMDPRQLLRLYTKAVLSQRRSCILQKELMEEVIVERMKGKKPQKLELEEEMGLETAIP